MGIHFSISLQIILLLILRAQRKLRIIYFQGGPVLIYIFFKVHTISHDLQK